ncbi:MAG: four helix bundle protein [Patescibacteria group bacterium]|nr:four helix bundle protein [Patescibacteria group bacterium]MBU4057596.1 four helix bundle protein [Patescibacteria group bacterium]MBU4115582.1 four helix bundle protein [Patescibacteria group bacterium]
MDAFQEKLKIKMNEYAHGVYNSSKKFPKDEIYGITSQIRRSSLSVVLNYIEGWARRKNLVRINFLEISYGSLQESKYLLRFCFEEKLMDEKEYEKLLVTAEEVGAMLWSEIKRLDNKK